MIAKRRKKKWNLYRYMGGRRRCRRHHGPQRPSSEEQIDTHVGYKMFLLSNIDDGALRQGKRALACY